MLTGEQENNGPPAPDRAEDGYFFVSASFALTKPSVDVVHLIVLSRGRPLYLDGRASGHLHNVAMLTSGRTMTTESLLSLYGISTPL